MRVTRRYCLTQNHKQKSNCIKKPDCFLNKECQITKIIYQAKITAIQITIQKFTVDLPEEHLN